MVADEDVAMPSVGNSAVNADHSKKISDYYLNRIGQAPLLPSKQEKALFEQLQRQTKFLSEILLTLQDSEIDSDKQEELKQVFDQPSGATDGQMEFSLESLNRLQTLIDHWKHDGYFAAKETITVDEKDDHNSPRTLELEAIGAEIEACLQQIEAVQRCLVEGNLRLVASIAKQFSLHQSFLSFLDLIQEGCIGLMKAIYKFRLQKGNRFSTYATWWISQAMRRALDEHGQLIRLPAYIIQARRRAEKALIDLTNGLGREPNISELAQTLEMTKSKLCQVLEAPKQFLSLDSPIEESDSNITVADLIGTTRILSPEEEILFQARQEVMEKLLSTLSRRQEAVIKLRYGLFDGKEHTLAEIGAKLKISRERVRQLEDEAKNKLRHPTRRHYWKEFLE